MLGLLHDIEIASDPALHVEQGVDHSSPVEVARAARLKVLFLNLLSHRESDQADEAASFTGSDCVLEQGSHGCHHEIHEYFTIHADLRAAQITARSRHTLFHCRLPSSATLNRYHWWYLHINS